MNELEDEIDIGTMKQITDEYYQLISSGLARRVVLRRLERIHKVTKNKIVNIIEGWDDEN